MDLEQANRRNIQEELVQAGYRMGNWVRRSSHSHAEVLQGALSLSLVAMVLMGRMQQYR